MKLPSATQETGDLFFKLDFYLFAQIKTLKIQMKDEKMKKNRTLLFDLFINSSRLVFSLLLQMKCLTKKKTIFDLMNNLDSFILNFKNIYKF